MADPKNTNDEPSIEEILSSIREIISDEDEDEVQIQEPKESNPVAERDEKEEDDILDLSAFAQEDETEIAGDVIEGESHIEDEPYEEFEQVHVTIQEIDMVDAEQDEEEEDNRSDILAHMEDVQIHDANNEVYTEKDTKKSDDDKDFLIDKMAEGATVNAMARLAENISLARNANGVTLEDIVKELLRPMLKNWLDDNLPDIIERLVSQELERLAQKAVRK